MKSKQIKHLMMRAAPDLIVRYDVDDHEKVVFVDLSEHFDSSLFTWLALTLENDIGIRVVEYQPGYKRVDMLTDMPYYRLVVSLAGVRFNATVAQKLSLQSDRDDEFTVCLLRECAPAWGNP